MKWLLNMKIRGKLLMLVVPLFVALIALTLVSISQVNTTKEELTRILYEEVYISTAAILNADRDFYQATVAEMELAFRGDALTSVAKEGLLKEYEENIAQVQEQIDSAMANIKADAELYSEYTHETKGLTMAELDQLFHKDFNDWKSLYDPRTGTGNMNAKQAVFDNVRNEIDVMTGILESYGKYREERIEKAVASRVYLALVLIAAVIGLLTALAVYLIVTIRRSIQYATDISRKVAAGDVTVEVDPRRLTKDEIGQLIATVDHEVRQAFREIAAAKAISDKQSRYQGEQVDKLVVNLERLAAGKLYCDMAAAEPDEDTRELYELYSKISDSLHLTVDTLKGYIAEISDVLGSIADGDLTKSIESEYKGDFVALKESINRIAQSLSEVMAEIHIAAEQVAAGTAQISEGSQAISQGATEQAGAIEELSATAAEIAEQTRQNAESANKANELTLAAKENAGHGNERMKAMQGAMAEINEASENISKIIKVIDDIAFQTNILALNAAVEAARAGVHGKGFAVVAEEVRNLAARSANAAKETTELIEGSIRKTEAGTKIADETAEALQNIVADVEKAAQLVGEIASASNEQTGSIAQINGGIEQMSQVVQTNSATSEEAAASAEELSSQAALLKDMVKRFKLREEEKTETPEDSVPEMIPEENDDCDEPEPDSAVNDKEFGKY